MATLAVPSEASPVLQRGSVGMGVRCVQWGVNHLSGAALMFGPQTPVDGQYGPATAGGVQQFQAQYATMETGWRTVDGRVGPMTGTILSEAGFGGAPAAWHCSEHVPYDPKLRGVAQRSLVLIRREIATITPRGRFVRAGAPHPGVPSRHRPRARQSGETVIVRAVLPDAAGSRGWRGASVG